MNIDVVGTLDHLWEKKPAPLDLMRQVEQENVVCSCADVALHFSVRFGMKCA